MARSILRAALAAGVVTLGATTALAQFGFLFGDPPPRPPGDVGPGGRQTLPQPPRQYPPPPQYPPQNYPPQNYPAPPGGAVQTRPLPPPPDGTMPPRGPAVGAPPAQRPPLRQPAEIPAPPPADEEVVAGPSKRIVHPSALFSGLDKITGRIINFSVEIGETVQFGALQLTPRACYTRPPSESANTDAFVEVDEVTLQGEVKRIFTGWMFASSPGLHAVEHPIYDLWLTDCRGGTQVVAADGSVVEPPPRAQAQPQPKAQPKAAPKAPQRQPPRRPPPQAPQGYPPFR